MTARSVIEVDVKSDAFKQFLGLYNEYKSSLAELPGEWGKTDKAVNSTAAGFGDMTAALMAQAEQHRRIDASEKTAGAARKKIHDDEAKAEKAKAVAADKYEKSVARTTAKIKETRQNITGIAGDLVSVSASVLKWVGIGGIATGLLGGGGLYGLDRLAASAGNSRRSAQGLGTTAGNEKAFGLNYSRLVDPASYLSNIENVASTPGLQYGIGSDIARMQAEGKDTADIGAALIPLIKQSFQQYGSNATALKASGLDNVISLQDAIRISKNSDADLGGFASSYSGAKSSLAVQDQTLKDWQDLDKQLNTAGDRIENILIKDLADLAPVIGHLSDQAVTLVDKWTKDLVPAIDHFATYLDSDKFKNDVRDFMAAVALLKDGVIETARTLGILDRPAPDFATSSNRDILQYNLHNPDKPQIPLHAGQSADDTTAPGQSGNENDNLPFRAWLPDSYLHHQQGTAPWETPSGDRHNPGNLRNVGGNGFQKFTSDDDGIRGMAHQLRLYENRDKLDTIDQIITKYAPANENDTAAYIKNVSDRTGFAHDQHLDLNDNGIAAKLISAMTKQENNKSNFSAPTVVTILNNTGGSATVSVAQLAS